MRKPMNLRNAIAQAKIEILKHMEFGGIPENVKCFGDLHDHIDANCLIGLCEDNPRYEGLWLEDAPEGEDTGCAPLTTAGYAFINGMQEAVDVWLMERVKDFPDEPSDEYEEGSNVLDPRELVDALAYMDRMYHAPFLRLEKRLDRATNAWVRHKDKPDSAVKTRLGELVDRLQTRCDTFTEAQDRDKLADFLEDVKQHANPQNGNSIVKSDNFEDFVREDLRSLGLISEEAENVLVVDWEATAARVRYDYSEVFYGETSYLVRDE